MAGKGARVKTVISTAGSRSNQRPGQQRGFTYLLILAALVIVGILAEVGVTLTSRVVQANNEQELLFRGQAYQAAIKSYYYAKAARRYPRSLEVLVKDPRFLHKRHIRQRYSDPVGQGDWLLLKNGRGEITGISSSSQNKPLKQANFVEALKKFEGATSYREWIFEFSPPKKTKKKK